MKTRALLSGILLFAAAAAHAQYATDFEGLNAAPDGVVLTGQDSFYLPPVTNSTDYEAYTYAGNAVGIPDHPGGGTIFVAGVNTDTLLARAQRDVSWGAGSWIMAADVCPNFIGTAPAAQNLGSLSANQADQVTFNFIMLATWVNVNTPDAWNASFVYFTATGTQTQVVIPDTNFQNLPIRKWYRWSTQVNYDTNAIEEIALTDLDTGTRFVYRPTDWYMRGGSSGRVTSTAFRMFTGGVPRPGGVMAWDNVSIGPAVACNPCDMNCDGTVDANDIQDFIGRLFNDDDPCCGQRGEPGHSGDTDGDGAVNANDIAGFIDCLFG